MNVKKKKTSRGFIYYEFQDRYGVSCNIQESSLATEPAIWFGCDRADAKIMWHEAEKHGIKASKPEGWVPFPIPSTVSMNTRMHLTQKQVKTLLPILKFFSEKGCLPK